jgi:hypothetical protein
MLDTFAPPLLHMAPDAPKKTSPFPQDPRQSWATLTLAVSWLVSHGRVSHDRACSAARFKWKKELRAA